MIVKLPPPPSAAFYIAVGKFNNYKSPALDESVMPIPRHTATLVRVVKKAARSVCGSAFCGCGRSNVLMPPCRCLPLLEFSFGGLDLFRSKSRTGCDFAHDFFGAIYVAAMHGMNLGKFQP